jgi:multiple sugar transport system permease protein
MGRRKRKYKIALLFLLPELILLVVFVLTPIIGTVVISFMGPNGWGLDNYYGVVTEKSPDKALVLPENIAKARPPPWGAFIHNIVWVAIHLPIVVFLGMTLAYLLHEVKGSAIVKSIFFLGMVIPMIVGGLLIRFMFDGTLGVVPLIFKTLGVKSIVSKTWTNYPQTALLSLILGSVWLWTGFSLTVYSAAYESLPKSYIEAAKIDGASGFQIFFKVVMPLLKHATIIVVIMTMLWDLKIFDIVYVSTLGGPGGSSNVMALVMYLYFARSLDYGRSSATAVILALITLIPGAWFIKRVMKGGRE